MERQPENRRSRPVRWSPMILTSRCSPARPRRLCRTLRRRRRSGASTRETVTESAVQEEKRLPAACRSVGDVEACDLDASDSRQVNPAWRGPQPESRSRRGASRCERPRTGTRRSRVVVHVLLVVFVNRNYGDIPMSVRAIRGCRPFRRSRCSWRRPAGCDHSGHRPGRTPERGPGRRARGPDTLRTPHAPRARSVRASD